MRRALIAALILAVLAVSVSGCHFHVTVHSAPGPSVLLSGG